MINLEVKKIAEELIGMPLAEFKSNQSTIKNHGKNNRLYHVVANDNSEYALKSYSQDNYHENSRLEVEFDSLNLLNQFEVFNVPKPIAKNMRENCGIYSWINGNKVSFITNNEIDQSIEFICNLYNLPRDKNFLGFNNAKEACFSADTIVRQIISRYNRLTVQSPFNVLLSNFLRDEFEPLISPLINKVTNEYLKSGLNFDENILDKNKILSPSDFGFHNSIKSSNGKLFFIDFEYFGWDDPSKLIADFLLHPAIDDINFGLNDWKTFYKKSKNIFTDDKNFKSRLLMNLPLYAMRWALILLNEFIPNNWDRRVFSGEKNSKDIILQNQITKAKKYTRLVRWTINSKKQNYLSKNYIDNFYLKSFN